MFTIIYNKDSGRVLSITSESNPENLRVSIADTEDFVFVDTLPEYDHWRQYLVVENTQLKILNKDLTPEQEQEIVNIVSQQEIESLIMELQRTDYITLKYIEGKVGEDEFKKSSEYRQGLRDRIEELEKKIIPISIS